MTGNRLAGETSPYLLQHKDNPVHWQPFAPAAFAEARQRGCPVLLSSGYAACHWCHVMAHESFEDEATARLMNAHFVCVKLDREERPDIDRIYMRALQMMGQPGGWPLTMFLDAAGRPFWGGTYFPKTAGLGRPSFADILREVAQVYAQRREEIFAQGGKIAAALAQALDSHRPGGAASGGAAPERAESGGATPERAAPGRAAQMIAQMIDPEFGGISGAPKFPNTELLRLLWRAGLREKRPDYGRGVLRSLEMMCRGGIYDHLGGGFARYSTDARWLAPHFEKMLYDNALLIDLLCEVWRGCASLESGAGRRLLAWSLEETAQWVLREMQTPEGGFASSLDADSEGEEGRFYVWRAQEIEQILGGEAAAFARAYDVQAQGNWEGKTILNRLASGPDLGAEQERRLAQARARLLAARAGRVRPACDDKVLSDWNGLMIAALAQAAVCFARPDWLAAARRAFDFIAGRMTDPQGRLAQSWRGVLGRAPACADGYANMIRAGLILFELTGEARCLRQAQRWLAAFDGHYLDAQAGSYFFTADDAPLLIARARVIADDAAPAANGQMIEVFARLHHVTGKPVFRERMERLAGSFSGLPEAQWPAMATYLNGCEFAENAAQITICADGAAERGFLEAAFASGWPHRTIRREASGVDRDLPDSYALVCFGTRCLAPLRTPEALAKTLASGG